MRDEKTLKVGDRVQLTFLNKPVGEIIDIELGSAFAGVVIPERYIVRWDDGGTGNIPANDLVSLSAQTP